MLRGGLLSTQISTRILTKTIVIPASSSATAAALSATRYAFQSASSKTTSDNTFSTSSESLFTEEESKKATLIIGDLKKQISLMKQALHSEPQQQQQVDSSLSPQELTHFQFIKSVPKTELWKEINAKENILARMEFDNICHTNNHKVIASTVQNNNKNGIGNNNESGEQTLTLKEHPVKSGWKIGANVLGIPLLMYLNYLLFLWLQSFHGWFGGTESNEAENKKNKKK